MKRSTQVRPNEAMAWKIQSECKNLQIDILSARCIVDRLLRQSNPGMIAQVADWNDVKRIAANILVISQFVRSIEEVAEPS